MSAYQEIRGRIFDKKMVVLDSAIGTEILRRDVSWADHQNLSRPTVIRAIAEDNIEAGADVVTTNTFQLTRRAILNHFRDEDHMHHIGTPGIENRYVEQIRAAIDLCDQARRRKNKENAVAIAGAITTLEWCFRPDMAPIPGVAENEYANTVGIMKEAGADIILLETMNSIQETKVAVQVCNNLDIPVWTAFVCDHEGNLLNGESIEKTVKELEPLRPDVILLNCAPPTDIHAGMVKLVPASKTIATGAYPHIGRFNPPEWMFTDEYPPKKYVEIFEKWVDLGATIIGGCCGVTPDHISALTKRFKN